VEPLYNIIIVRLGEITIKSKKVRRKFEKRLIENIKDALNRNKIRFEKVYSDWGRIYIVGDLNAVNVVKRVFGVTSISPAYYTNFKNFKDLIQEGENFFKEKVKNKKFAVRANRVGDHDFRSPDIEEKLGSRLLRYSKGVDLKNPDVTTYVEVRYNKVYFFTEIFQAYGGLPIGVEGKSVALVSGGYDSIVAAWFLLKRGSEVDFIFCNLDGQPFRIAVLHVLKTFIEKWCYGYDPTIYILNFKELVREIQEKCDPRIFNVILKRLMYKAAEKIAKKTDGKAIITGESLGQVSSQTLQNLYVSSQAVNIPIFRPLIGFDKNEIIELSKRIGTFSASSRVKEYCGALSFHPKTFITTKEIMENEKRLGELEKLLDAIIEKSEVLKYGQIKIQEIFLDISYIPENATVIDLRPREKYEKWHIPNSINIPFNDIENKLNKLKKDKIYILACDEGALSQEIAYLLRNRGIEAYSLKGGIRKYKKKIS